MAEILKPSQCRAARELLGWTMAQLAARCGLEFTEVSGFEEGARLSSAQLRNIKMVLLAEGVRFTPTGVVCSLSAEEEAPNVRVLRANTKLDLPPERVLQGAQSAGLRTVLVLGWEQSGELYNACSTGSEAEALMLVETFKHKLLSGEYQR